MSYEDKVERLLEKTASGGIAIPLAGAVLGSYGNQLGTRDIQNAVNRGEVSPEALQEYADTSSGAGYGALKGIAYPFAGSLVGGIAGGALTPREGLEKVLKSNNPAAASRFMIPAMLGTAAGMGYGFYRAYKTPREQAQEILSKQLEKGAGLRRLQRLQEAVGKSYAKTGVSSSKTRALKEKMDQAFTNYNLKKGRTLITQQPRVIKSPKGASELQKKLDAERNISSGGPRFVENMTHITRDVQRANKRARK